MRHWEIGNEPYLKSHFPKPAWARPICRRANAFIAAMKKVDPSIHTGLALRNDTLGGVEATPFKGYNDTVLAGVTQPFEFVSLHGSYFPVTFTKGGTDEELFLATMAGGRVHATGSGDSRTLLGRHHPGTPVRLAVTEYNALYSTDILRWGLPAVFLSQTDRYIESMAGALFVADALTCSARPGTC